MESFLARSTTEEETPEDWKKHRKATDCHICIKSLFKDLFLDSISVYAYKAKATEDAALPQLNLSQDREEKDSQNTQLTSGSTKLRKHACSAQTRCLWQTSKTQ